MPRCKAVDRSPKFIPVVWSDQIHRGTFEFTLDHLIDHELDLSGLDKKFKNDKVGASAYDPRVMLKVVLYAYSRGIISSREIDGYVPDKRFRLRDAAFQTAQRHRSFKALVGRKRYERKFFGSADFDFNPENGKLTCTAGKELYTKDRNFKTAKGYHGTQYMAKKTDCRVCELRLKCLRNPDSPARTVFKIAGRRVQETFSQKMIRKVESAAGRFLYGMRMGIVEPVFANFRHMVGLDRFTLRGKAKVNIQWRLFAVVHNIHKLQRFGLAGAG